MKWCIIYVVTLFGILKVTNADFPEVDGCHKAETFFKHRNSYTYEYTARTSSSFVGATPSSSGTSITCTVVLEVPRKCEMVMKVEDCVLSEREPSAEEKYRKVDQSKQFEKELARHPVYFQMDKGMVIDNTIITDAEESLATLNFKRGILSALQFDIKKPVEYDKPLQQADIFGLCPATYTFSETDVNTVNTYRNLRDCSMVQIFRKQFQPLMSTIRSMSGGLVEGKISEGYYPFQSDVTCSYQFNNHKRINDVYCHQRHFFRPLAYEGEILATAMANITQHLELKGTQFSKLDKPDPRDFQGPKRQIKYDFGETDVQDTTVPQLQAAMEALVTPFMADNNEQVPLLYGDLIELMRKSKQEVLSTFMSILNSCKGEASCPDEEKAQMQLQLFADGLETCGTEACILQFIQCLHSNHVPSFMEMRFLNSLPNLPPQPENVLSAILDYCKTSGKSKCWLTLGTMLNVVYLSDDVPMQKSDTLGLVLSHMSHMFDTCNGDHTQDLVQFAKTMSNIGATVAKRYYNQFVEEEMLTNKVHLCLQSSGITKRVRHVLLKTLTNGIEELGFVVPTPVMLTLFEIVEDVTMDITSRAMAFSFLMKTKDPLVIERLVEKMSSADTVKFKQYMKSCVATFLENDFAGYLQFRNAWESFLSSRHEKMYIHPDLDLGASKSWHYMEMFKLPLTEYFGLELYADLVFEQGDGHFSTLTVSLNSLYQEQKYNIMEFSINIEGFDFILDVIQKRSRYSVMDLYKMYKAAVRAGNSEQERKLFAEFQQDVMEAVVNILNRVNHPDIKDFDIIIDFVTQGKETGYFSLQEILSYFHKLKTSSKPGQPSPFQTMMQDLMKSKMFPLFKCTEFAGISKVFPTIAGLPLNMTVKLLGMNKIHNTLQSNVPLFMAKQSPVLSGGLKQHIAFSIMVFGELMIPVGLHHSSGIRMEILFGSDRDASFKLMYGHDKPGPDGKYPTHPRLQFDLEPLSHDKDSEKVVYARGRQFLLHHYGMTEVEADGLVESQVQQCLPSEIQMGLGRSFCINFRYPAVQQSQRHAYFPFTGPFDMSLVMERVDNVGAYNVIFEYKLEQDSHSFFLTHYGKGDTFERLGYINITFSRSSRDRGVSIHSEAPEFGLKHELTMTTGFLFLLDFRNFLWLKSKPYLGIVFTVSETHHFNFTIPGASWDIQTTYDWKYEDSELIQEWTGSGKFYCTQERPLLYLLHWDPLNVATTDFITKLDIGYSSLTKHGEKIKQTFTISVGDQVITLIDRPTPSTSFLSRLWTLSFKLGDEMVTLNGSSGVDHMIGDCGGWQCPGYHANVDLTSDQYNIAMMGEMSMGRGDIQVTGTLECTNNQLNEEGNRLKRSIKSIYQRFKQIEEAAVDEIIQVENSIFGEDDDDEEEEENDGVVGVEQLTLLDILPTFPSIWDLKNWKAELDVHVKIRQVSNDRRNYLTTLKLHHPWSGGYADLHQELLIGHMTQNNREKFGFWLNGSQEFLFTKLDGSPFILPNGEQMIIQMHGDAHIERIQGEKFTLGVHHMSSMVQLLYEITFDWDAASHHEPLFHVISQQTNKYLPFLDHKYEEFFTIEHHLHILQNATFEHKMLNFQFETELNLAQHSEAKYIVSQNGSIDINVLDIDGGFDYNYKIFQAGKITLDLIFHSEPSKTNMITMKPTSDKTLTFTNNVKNNQSPDVIPMWQCDFTLKGLSIREATFTWFPAFDDVMKVKLKDPLGTSSYHLSQLEARLASLTTQPVLETTLPFSSVTLQDVLLQYVMPLMMSSVRTSTTFMANFVPMETRIKLRNQPGPKVPPRLGLLLQQLRKYKEGLNTEDTEFSLVRLFPRAALLTVQGLKKINTLASLMVAKRASEKNVMNDRQLVVGWTDIYITTSFMHLSDLKLSYSVKYIDNIFFNSDCDGTLCWRPSSQAAVFGRSGGPLHIKALDHDGLYQIPAIKGEECTYLLSADVITRLFAVIHSPSSITVLTEHMTVSLDREKNVFINNCKQASTDPEIKSSGGHLIVEQSDLSVKVKYPSVLELICYKIPGHSCVLTVKGGFWNGTIGLFGTNDGDSFTDRRLLDGTLAVDVPSWLSQFALAGPAHCFSSLPVNDIPELQQTESQIDSYYDNCSSQLSTIIEWSCPYELYISLKKVCNTESKTSVQFEDTCYLYGAGAGLCKGSNPEIPDFCKQIFKPDVLEEIKETLSDDDVDNDEEVDEQEDSNIVIVPYNGIQAGSLDVVFVVSQHLSMGQTHAWEYITDLVEAEWPVHRATVRMAVVSFAGKGNQIHPTPIKDAENRYFFSMEDYDESMFEGVQTVGDQSQDAFEAINIVADLPFSLTAHKIIITLMTQEQASGIASNLETLKEKLMKRGIVYNHISTYGKLANPNVIGVTWSGNTITKSQQYDKLRELPQDDYMALVVATKGAVWDMRTLDRGRVDKVNRIIQEFYDQTMKNPASCDT